MNLKKEKLVKEIERKWLVKPELLPKNLNVYPYKGLFAGYFEGEDGKDVRIRNEGGKYFKVIKVGRGLVKDIGQGDIRINKKEFDALWPKTKGRRIFKKRYYIPHGKLTIELDKYRGFKDFYTVEVEFKTAKRANKFNPPKWFGRELTEDVRYSSNSLATKGMPKGAL